MTPSGVDLGRRPQAPAPPGHIMGPAQLGGHLQAGHMLGRREVYSSQGLAPVYPLSHFP